MPLYFHIAPLPLTVPALHADCDNMLSTIIRAGYAQLVLSCHISTLLNVLHLTLHLFSDTLLYDHMVTSYVASYYAL